MKRDLVIRGVLDIVAVVFDLFLDVILGVVEFANAFTQSAHEFRNLFAAEKQQYDHQDDDDLVGPQNSQKCRLNHNQSLVCKDTK